MYLDASIRKAAIAAGDSRTIGLGERQRLRKLDQGKEALILHSSLRRLSISHNARDRCGQGDQFTFL